MSTSLAATLAVLAAVLSAAMTLAWRVAGRGGRSGWIDAIWSFAVGLTGIAAALAWPAPTEIIQPRQWLVAAMAGFWSMRLGLHIALRTLHGGDDPRYRKLRLEWGSAFRRRLFWFLQIQAAAAWLLTCAIMAAAHRPAARLGLGDALGILIFCVALGGESLADRQLARFSADVSKRGQVCDIGLWRYSRHPNYFCEWLGWLAYAVIAIDLGGAYPWGWCALIGPLFMYWLLVHVSGIPPLEAHMLRSRGERFRAYQRRTNAFWPGPPRRASAGQAVSP